MFSGNNHLLLDLRLYNWPWKRGILQNIKASNFVRSTDCLIYLSQNASILLKFVNKQQRRSYGQHDPRKTQKKVTDNDNISIFMISDRSFDFGNLLILGGPVYTDVYSLITQQNLFVFIPRLHEYHGYDGIVFNEYATIWKHSPKRKDLNTERYRIRVQMEAYSLKTQTFIQFAATTTSHANLSLKTIDESGDCVRLQLSC